MSHSVLRKEHPRRERLTALKAVKKSHGNVFAVGGVNMHVDQGEVVGLLGDKGAGKSRDAGIETVFQDRAVAVQQTIIRNIFMGREITTALGLLDMAKQRSEAERLMREIGVTSKVFSPDSIVGPTVRR